jgi:16S rRNA (cytidine1402-2'-O)-methyltransferase
MNLNRIMAKGKLLLVPTTMGSDNWEHVIPEEVKKLTINTRHFAVENIKTARRYLRRLDRAFPIDESVFYILNKNTDPSELPAMIKAIKEGHDVAIISEAGCPGIADPGSKAVSYAHENDIRIEPWVGPSSIFLALMGSGFSGQSFAFSGYLPIEKKEKTQAIRQLEQKLFKTGETQIFMETPYRNNQLVEDILKICAPQMKLCIAKNINSKEELIKTDTIQNWKKNKPELHKVPCIFLLGTN